jgi:hypothetical protein
MKKLPKSFLSKLNSIEAKRPKTVIQHILKHGYVTTEELETQYGYQHPPRAARDVRELGIPLITFRVKSSDGRSIGAYKFGDIKEIGDMVSKVRGRTALSAALKKALIEKYGAHCMIYLQSMEERMLQVDHRIPYEIGGEQDIKKVERFMLLSPSANRAKSWTCEHCSNWIRKDKSYCMSCFWAYPENYTHVADVEERQIIITYTGDEIEDYNRLISIVGKDNAEKCIKDVIKKNLL